MYYNFREEDSRYALPDRSYCHINGALVVIRWEWGVELLGGVPVDGIFASAEG